MQQHSWRVTVESELGNGHTYTAWLPKVSEPVE